MSPKGDQRPKTGNQRKVPSYGRISDDLLRGAYPPGERLPVFKELQGRYGVCYTTLRRALHALAEDGRLQRFGRGFRVPEPLVRRRPRDVVVVAPHDYVDGLLHLAPSSQSFWPALAQCCDRLAVGIRPYGYFTAMPEERKRYEEAFERFVRSHSDDVLGYLVLGRCGGTGFVPSVVTTLLANQKRVAVIDDSGCTAEANRMSRLNNSHLMRVFAIGAGRAPGHSVANALLSLGHRRVLCLSPSVDLAWANERLAGLRQGFANAGHAGAVSALVPVSSEQERALRLKVSPRRTNRRSDAKTHWQAGPRWYQRDKAFGMRVRETLQLRAWASEAEPALDKALVDSTASVWVGLHDRLALTVLGFLRSRGVDIPRRLSLVGFDNTFEAFLEGVASYDFGIGGTVGAALGFLCKQDDPKRRNTLVLESTGRLVVRRILGPAPG